MKDRFDNTMILYRPVGLQELELIYDSGMKAFPARLPQQPIFYPVLQLEYARQIAFDWNAKSGGSAGYVTQFKVEDQYISQFEEHAVGSSQHQELWIPSEEMEKFNQQIIGHIKVLEAYFGDAFQGFVPDTFGLQGKNAVAQFTQLANAYLYNRMDFYLEIKRNHKAIFLNYPFWQTYDFKNPGLKEKIIKAIKEAWLTSFPKTPLVNPVPEDITLVKQNDSPALDDTVDEVAPSLKQTGSSSVVDTPDQDVTLAKQTVSKSFVHAVHEVGPPEKKTYSDSLLNTVEEVASAKPTDAQVQSLVHPVHEDSPPVRSLASHFSQGLELGLSGKYQEAIAELSRAIEEDPEHVIAHTSLGIAFHRVGEEDRALSCYEEALKIDPNYAEAHYFRANVLYSQGNVRDAIASYTIALGLEPDLIEAYQKTNPEDRLTDYSPAPAEIYRIAKPAHRIIDLNRSLEANPGQAALLKERAAEYSRLWNYEKAIANYSSSLAIEPDDAAALYARGLAYEQIGQIDRALEDYQQAIAINPQLSDEYIDRGVTFGKMGNFRQSVSSLTEALRLAPGNPDVYFNRGTSYFQLGDLERAIEDFTMVIQLSANDEAAYYWRGISNEAAGRPPEAIADYKQFLALSHDPDTIQEIEERLSQWNTGKPDSSPRPGAVSDDKQKTDQVPADGPNQELDLYSLIVALGERALNSIWFGSSVECYGENAAQLYSLTDENRPIRGRDLLRITLGIRQTIKGDFTAFDPDATSHWLFIRAWDGSGFYVEVDDRQYKEQLKARFPSVENVDGAEPLYEGLFIHV